VVSHHPSATSGHKRYGVQLVLNDIKRLQVYFRKLMTVG